MPFSWGSVCFWTGKPSFTVITDDEGFSLGRDVVESDFGSVGFGLRFGVEAAASEVREGRNLGGR